MVGEARAGAAGAKGWAKRHRRGSAGRIPSAGLRLLRRSRHDVPLRVRPRNDMCPGGMRHWDRSGCPARMIVRNKANFVGTRFMPSTFQEKGYESQCRFPG